MNKQPFAYTAPTADYPEYVNITEDADTGDLIITVRQTAPPRDGRQPHRAGPSATMRLPKSERTRMAEAIGGADAAAVSLRRIADAIEVIASPAPAELADTLRRAAFAG